MASTTEAFGATAAPLRVQISKPKTDHGDKELLGSGFDALLSVPDLARQATGTDCKTEGGSSTEPSEPVRVDPLVRLSPTHSPMRRFEMLQQWEGVVTEVSEESAWCRLIDLTRPESEEEVAEIPLAEIPDPDLPICKPGSVFYWSIGFERSRGGQIRRVSEIRLRRTAKWSRRAIASMHTEAEGLARKLLQRGDNVGRTSETE
ncbi:MAG: hypothetical protein GVY16_04210 [Planctomycetes bacterium]|jgi:hypothetical protein|nr:hypothetical protein [Planctomycetota bacterium]